ncbi:hypothetical protein KC19_VG179000 [Ceratodon purpureus]|uniref:Uncharacterized protein n=1 Tax=Ceratodon purpureus TaxID=3225 RepID=A0A8T0HR91_CERPU|nr:hypothetical protein KC19_VG179000 [Ceratodon purpureus]
MWPSAAMKESLETTWVTTSRSILNRLTAQFPLEIACCKPFVSVSSLMGWQNLEQLANEGHKADSIPPVYARDERADAALAKTI